MSDVNIQISNDVIKGIIEKKIQTAIAETLAGGQATAITDAIVHRVLSLKVDSSGQRSTSDYQNTNDFIEWLCRDAITRVARQCIEEWAVKQKPKIEAAITKHITANTKNLAEGFVNSLQECMKTSYRTLVTLEIKKD